MIQKTNYKVGKGWVKWFLLFYLFTLLPVNMSAQPQRRRTQQQQQQAAAGQKNGNNAITIYFASRPVPRFRSPLRLPCLRTWCGAVTSTV